MKNQSETVIGKKVYGKPMIEMIKLNDADIICTSNPQVDNPWSGNEEEEW